MTSIKKITTLLLVICLVTCPILVSGCKSKKDSEKETIVVVKNLDGKPVLVGNIPCSFPLSKDGAKLNFLAYKNTDAEYDDVYVWKKYEDMTGVDVNWTTVDGTQRSEAVYTALMNKMDYDLILRCRVSSNNLSQYGDSGLILDLAKNDLLKNNAPNCWAYLQSHPDTLASVMNPDGSIYALPQVNSGAELRVSRKIFVNKVWLNNLGLKLPTTTEELYQLLIAFRDKDANGNGDPNDEIPLCAQDWESIQNCLSGAFGITNRGIHNVMVDCDESTGKVRFTYATDGYHDFLEYINKLYSEKLIDQNIFDITKEEWTDNALNDRFGVYTNTNLASFPNNLGENWVGIDVALTGPNGDQLWSAIRANFHSTGNAIIPATCDNPELVLRWLDYFWTDEGTLFYHMGIQDDTFVANNDGTYDYSPSIYSEITTKKKPFDEVVATYSPYPGGGNPTVEIAPYFKGGEMAPVPSATARALFPYGPKEYWPSFTFTDSETKTLNSISADIEKYCNAMQINFITGKNPLSDWDNYIAQLNKFSISKYLEIYQAALERYHKLTNK